MQGNCSEISWGELARSTVKNTNTTPSQVIKLHFSWSENHHVSSRNTGVHLNVLSMEKWITLRWVAPMEICQKCVGVDFPTESQQIQKTVLFLFHSNVSLVFFFWVNRFPKLMSSWKLESRTKLREKISLGTSKHFKYLKVTSGQATTVATENMESKLGFSMTIWLNTDMFFFLKQYKYAGLPPAQQKYSHYTNSCKKFN